MARKPPDFYKYSSPTGHRKQGPDDDIGERHLQVALTEYIELGNQEARAIVFEWVDVTLRRFTLSRYHNNERSEEIHAATRDKVMQLLDDGDYEPRRGAKLSTYVYGVMKNTERQYDAEQSKRAAKEQRDADEQDESEFDHRRQQVVGCETSISNHAARQNTHDTILLVRDAVASCTPEVKEILVQCGKTETQKEICENLNKDSRWLKRRLQPLKKVLQQGFPALIVMNLPFVPHARDVQGTATHYVQQLSSVQMAAISFARIKLKRAKVSRYYLAIKLT